VLVQRIGRPIVELRILRRLTIGFLVGLSILQLIAAIGVAVVDIFDPAVLGRDVNNIASIGSTVTAALAAVCVFLGLRLIRRDRLAAYGWFERAVLVNLLLTQVFAVSGSVPRVAVDRDQPADAGRARRRPGPVRGSGRCGRGGQRSAVDILNPQPQVVRTAVSSALYVLTTAATSFATAAIVEMPGFAVAADTPLRSVDTAPRIAEISGPNWP
jgi:hypothetical protein